MKRSIFFSAVIVFSTAGLFAFANKEERQSGTFCSSTSKHYSNQLQTRVAPGMDTLPADGITEQVTRALQELEQQLQVLQQQMATLQKQQSLTYQKAMNAIPWQQLQEDSRRAIDQSVVAMDRARQKMSVAADVQARQLALQGERLALKSRDMATSIEKRMKLQLQLAQDELQKNNPALQESRNFINDLAADKLIDKDGKYMITIEKGELYINGKKQPASISERYKKKYKKYFESGNKTQLHADDMRQLSLVNDDGLI